MRKHIIISSFILSVFLLNTAWGFSQDIRQLKGKVWAPHGGKPLEGAVVTIPGAGASALTDSLGQFSFDLKELSGEIEVWSPGCLMFREAILERTDIQVRMLPENTRLSGSNLLRAFAADKSNEKTGNVSRMEKADFAKGSLSVEEAIHNGMAGLRMTRSEGMPGEGSYMNVRGINSLIANSAPLIVINNVPYLPDRTESHIINGYTPGILSALNPNDIQNITFLKGAEASLFGSLGSNGVLLIETDNAKVDLDTKVEFIGQYGVASSRKTLPVMQSTDYKTFVGNIALTRYDDPAEILGAFPFLKDDPNYFYNYLYNNETNWQDLIYRDAFVTDNLVKVKGGDAIAKYDLSLGYLNQNGIVRETDFSRYHMRLNANMNITKKLELFTAMSMAYMTGNLQEQGMSLETNPLLAALAKSPLASPYKSDQFGNRLPDYAPIREADGTVIVNNAVTNPLALLNLAELTSQCYDILMNMGLNYQFTPSWSVTGIFGYDYNYNRMEAFIPGMTNLAFMPLSDGLADNTVRAGVKEASSSYFNLNGSWKKRINAIHDLNATLGWQAKMTQKELDYGSGYNTSSDYYKTLGNVGSVGRSIGGYIEEWTWMNFFGRAEYTYNHQLSAGVHFSYDAASSTGDDVDRFYFYPAVNLAWNIKNSPWLVNSSTISKLRLRGEVSRTGNTEFSSMLSRYYYQTQQFRELSGIVRAGIPNTRLSPEITTTANIGLDIALFKHYIDLSVDFYSKKTADVIAPKTISPVFGKRLIYENMAEIENKGLEIGLNAYLFRNRDFDFSLGGTLALNQNKLVSLGGSSENIIELEDGSALISRVGESLYSFYGYQTQGVYATTAEAQSDGLTNYAGVPFEAGDIRFVNTNDDKIIDERDRVLLGNAEPDFFGRFYATARYKHFSLSANFSYSYGNDAYNAVRREFESMDSFNNQLISTNRRWQEEGQATDMPKAIYGDPRGNARFSDRWIEDASYIKLRELTLSYDFGKNVIPFLQGGTVFLSGENLLVFTKYLGLDPEFSYSYSSSLQGFDYGKIAQPRTIKCGFKLQF